MTLICALEGQDGLVLASDSRGTIGDPRGLTAIRDVEKKIFKLSSLCGIAVSGSSELASQMIDEFLKKIEEESLEQISSIVDKIYNISKTLYNQWFGVRHWVTEKPLVDQRPVIIFILCGYNKIAKQTREELEKKIFFLNSQLDFAPHLCTSGYMMAGIPQYATYLMHKFYNPNMTVDNLKALAAYLISETASQDPKVGGPIKMAIIDSKAGYTEIADTAIRQIVK